MARHDAPTSAESFDGGHERGFVIGGISATRDADYFIAMARHRSKLGAAFFFPVNQGRDRRFAVDRANLVMLQRELLFAQGLHIKLVVVAGIAPELENALWIDAALRASFVDAWVALGTSLRDELGVAGLDLMNEPNPPSSTGNLAERQLQWRSLAEQTIAALRAKQVMLPIIFESVGGAAGFGFRDLVPLSDTQVVYSFHFYTPHDITHQRVDDSWRKIIPYPAGVEWGLGNWDPQLGITAIDKTRLELEMRDVVAFQDRYKVPIYVGEFSCVRWAPNDSAQRYIADVLDIFTRHKWSWTYHEYRGWPGWDAEIASNDPRTVARSRDAPVMRLLRAQLARTTD